MQAFRVLGVVFIGICALTLFSGFGGVGGFGMLSPVVFTLLPLGIVFLVVGTALARTLGPSLGSLRDGIAAQATVRAVRPTNMRVNGQPVMRVDLDLDIPGRGRVPVSVRRTVPLDRRAALRAGAVLPAMVDPRDARRFAIDWERVGLSEPDTHPFAALGGLAGAAGFDLSGLVEGLGRAGIHIDPALLAGADVRVDGPTVIDVTPGPAAAAAAGTSVTPADPGAVLPTAAVVGEPVVGEPAAGYAADGAATAGDPAASDSSANEAVPASALLGTAAFAPGLPSLGRWGATGADDPTPPPGTAAAAGTATVDVTGEALSALRALGEPGRGVIREAVDLGIAIGDGRLVRLRLDVIPDGRTGFPADHVALVPAVARWRIVTGVTLPLFMDLSGPSRLAIDWTA